MVEGEEEEAREEARSSLHGSRPNEQRERQAYGLVIAARSPAVRPYEEHTRTIIHHTLHIAAMA